jgi:hypothetical protein
MIRVRVLLALAAVLSTFAGCVLSSDDDCCPRDDGRPPAPPAGLTSTTGDGAVFLSWIANREPDFDFYRVYVGPEPRGPYELVASVSEARYTHRRLSNGITLYYGVSAVDVFGRESDLNDEVVFDTPRPEGFGLVLREADGDGAYRSGFDFSSETRTHWESPATDVFYDVFEGTPYLAVPDEATDIQDAGYIGFDDLTWAPDAGWSEVGFVEAIAGHVYVIWTRDDHFAKVRVVEVDPEWIEIDWAYQIDKGNPELLRARSSAPRARPGS